MSDASEPTPIAEDGPEEYAVPSLLPDGETLADLPPAAEPAAEEGLHRRSMRHIAYGLLALAAVLTFGTIGYIALGWTPGDAFYQVIITVSGVGFTEVHPIETGWLRLLTILVIAFGLVATGYTVAGILRFVTEEELRQIVGHQRVRRQIETLKDHTIVAGFGRMGALICAELREAKMPFVVIERSAEALAEIDRRGYLHLQGDATEEKVLEDAGLLRARALVTAIASDAASVFITLTARQMAPGVQIIARAEQPSTQKKLVQAGANQVVLPAAIGAHRIASLLTNPSAVEFAELVTHRGSLAIEMDELPLKPGHPFAGKTLREADISRRTGVVVVAVKRADGHVDFPPTGGHRLDAGDVIVLLGRPENLAQFRREFGVREG